MKKTWSLLFSLMLVLSLVLSACGTADEGGQEAGEDGTTGGEGAEGAEQIINLIETAEVPSMDSVLSTDAVSFNVMNQVFEGLYRLGPDNTPVPGVAESHEVSDDGLTYTFKLRENAKWTNGEPVTAHDFVYAWQKVIDPNTAAEYAYILNDIKNAKAIQEEGSEIYGDVSQLGVTAADDYTLEVQLENPVPYFLGLTTFPTFLPQKQAFVEEQGTQYALEVENMIFNGPFVMSEWSHGEGFKLTKNPDYWEADAVKLEQANYKIIKDVATGVNLYETGAVDRAGLSAEFVDQYSAHADFGTRPEPTLFFFRLNQQVEALKNKDIRLAISMGWDKQALTDVILNNGSIPANFLVPKDFVFDEEGNDFRSKNPAFNESNIEKAKEHWEKGLAALGTDSLELEFLNYDSESSKKIGEYVKNQLETNLPGLTLTIKQQPFKQKLELESALNYQISFSGWGPDYQDPMTFLDMFITDGPHNQMAYSNPEYDAIIDKSKTDIKDLTERWTDLQEAERILLEEDVAIVPVFQRGVSFLQRGNIKNYVIHPFGPDTSLKWTYIE